MRAAHFSSSLVAFSSSLVAFSSSLEVTFSSGLEVSETEYFGQIVKAFKAL